MEQKISITKLTFFQAGKRSQLAFDLTESTPVFLSGPAGQGKEMIQALLTHWYLPNHSMLKSDESQPDLLLYQWSGKGKKFVSAHTIVASKPISMFITGEIEQSWGKDTPIPSIGRWKKELEKEGRTVSKVLNGLNEWDGWLTNQRSPLQKKQLGLFLSPEMNTDTLRLLRYRPEPHDLSWEQVFANQLLQLVDIPDGFQQKIYRYFHERAIIIREEKLSRSLPGLRKWDQRKEQIRQERQLLTGQWPDILNSHKQEQKSLQKHLAETTLPVLEEERLEQLRMRLGWIQWEMEQKTDSALSKTTIDTPASWWKVRKILASEQQAINTLIQNIQNQLSTSSHTEGSEEEVRISSELKRLDKQLPKKISALERLKMKLELLRKEKKEEEQTQDEVNRSELGRLQHIREGLEIRAKELEVEAKRPKNTFRHWLEKNYPDWEDGPGKVLHPSVLESRGMFPALERINDLFFGVRIHMDELPPVEHEQIQSQNPTHKLEQVRHQIATFQIQVQHEKKLLHNRYRQKSRLLHKSIQQAEYDLQLHSRTQHQLRQRKKEIRQRTIIRHEKNRLALEYRAKELQSSLEQPTCQIQQLDAAWEHWLEENNPQNEGFSLTKLQTTWKQEVSQQEKRVRKARAKLEASRLLATAAIDNWNLRDLRFSKLIESGELPSSDHANDQPASLTIEQWEQRWELMEAEEISWDQDHQSWVEEYPALQEYLDLGLEEFEETEIAAKRSELAAKWFGELSSLAQLLVDARKAYSDQLNIWRKWPNIWRNVTQQSTFSEFPPEVHLLEHPFWRAVEMLASLVEDHQHAAAGSGLFNQHTPQQTLIRTLHVLDNLYEGWITWKDALTRMNLGILRLSGLSQPDHQEVFNYLYHLSLVLSQPGPLPGSIPIPEPEKIPNEIISQMVRLHPWVICSQYPLAIKGDHLWVTEGKKAEQWEALPFAMR